VTRNVVLIVLDTVRKDYFDEHATELQERADTVVDQCRAASAWSVPSHASMLTGELPHQHGIHTHNRDFSQLDRDDTFLGEFDRYETVGTSANVYAGSAYGFDGLFDDFIDVSPTHRFPDGLDIREFGLESDESGVALYADVVRASLAHDHPVQSLGNAVLSKLYHLSRELPLPALLDDGASIVSKAATAQVERTPEPFFQFVNFMDVHGPLQHVRGYDASLHSVPNGWSSSDCDTWEVVAALDEHRDYLERYRGLYAAAVDYLDRKVAAFVDHVEDLTERETTFVITADHGENLGYPEDEGLLDHTSSLTEALLHVPFVVVNPPAGWIDSFENRNEYLSQLELGELISTGARNASVDVFSEEAPAEVVGRTAGVSPIEDEERWDRMIRCFYKDESKYIWDSLENWEVVNPDGLDPNTPRRETDTIPETEYFESGIIEYKRLAREDNGEEVDVDARTENRLRDLGYL